MMSDDITLSDDERAFEDYLDSLSGALQHGSRERPFRDYCTGLLLPDGRKSVEPMAARLAPSTTRTTHKKLLNFVSDGAWSDEAVLVAMRREILPALEAHGAVRRWIVDETGMAKKGTHSVGVARQYCGELGKIENCQVLVSLSVANAVAALPIAARLYLPEAWTGDPTRRAAVGVPLDVTFQTKPSIALDLIGRALAGGVPPGMVLADEVYGSTAEFRRGVWGWITPWRCGPPPWCRRPAPGVGRACGGARKILCPCGRWRHGCPGRRGTGSRGARAAD